MTTTVSTPSTWLGQGQAAQDVVGDPPAGVADDVGLAQVQAERGEHVDAGVHAGDHGQVPARSGVGHVGAGGGVALVGGEQPVDLSHACWRAARPELSNL